MVVAADFFVEPVDANRLGKIKTISSNDCTHACAARALIVKVIIVVVILPAHSGSNG